MSYAKRIAVGEADEPEEPDLCGSAIDLVNPEKTGSKGISLATIYLEPGKKSTPHRHERTEEVYYFLEGRGRVVVDNRSYDVTPGVAVYIPLRSVHQVENDSSHRLKFISADSPPFDPSDVITL